MCVFLHTVGATCIAKIFVLNLKRTVFTHPHTQKIISMYVYIYVFFIYMGHGDTGH